MTMTEHARWSEEALRGLEARVLDRVSSGAPLREVLDDITATVDPLLAGGHCSVLLVREGAIWFGSAPGLPETYNRAIDGVAIGPQAGSCGTAAWRGEQVIVTDIATDPLWADFRTLAAQHGLEACWSTPVIGASGEVLATFAIYPARHTAPAFQDQALIARIGQFLRVAIERSRERAQLLASEHRYRSLFGMVPVAILEMDWSAPLAMLDALRADGIVDLRAHLAAHPAQAVKALRAVRLLDVNETTLQMFEAQDRAAFNAGLETVFSTSAALDSFVDELLAFADGAGVHESQKRLRTVQGRPIMVLQRTSCTAVDRASGLVAACMLDISARLEAEEQLRQAQRLEAVGQLTGGIAHDFNNLLTVILGNAELLTEALQDDPRLGTLAEMIATAAGRGAELTNRLLSFARRQSLDPQTVDVTALLAGMSPLLHRSLGEQIDVRILDQGQPWLVLADPPQLESAILNLCINARDAMPEGGQLTLELSSTVRVRGAADSDDAGLGLAPGDYVVLRVTDTGRGMDAYTRSRAFEPFFTTKPHGKGSGLGLSMVHGFVKQSRGDVLIDSVPGQGTTVRLYLPRAQDSAMPKRPVQTAPPAQAPQTGSERILLVEDNDAVRAFAQQQLRSLGYDVVAVGGGAEALEVLREGNFDLLFTDVVMPGGLSGPQLAQRARQLHAGLPVLFTSGYTDSAVSTEEGLGRVGLLLQKPYRREHLAARVRQALSRGASAHTASEVGPLR